MTVLLGYNKMVTATILVATQKSRFSRTTKTAIVQCGAIKKLLVHHQFWVRPKVIKMWHIVLQQLLLRS